MAIKMRNGAWFIAITLLLLSGTFAFADDKSECLDGIKAIKAAVAKKPPKPVLDKLNGHLIARNRKNSKETGTNA